MTVQTAGHPGKLTKSVRVETDDPKQPVSNLTVEINVTVALGLAKRYLRADNLRLGQPWSERIAITAKAAARPVHFEAVRSDLEGLSGRIVGDPGARHLEVRWTPHKVGRLRGTLRIATDHPKVKELALVVSGQIRGDIVLQPERLVLDDPGDGSEVSGTVELSARSGRFQIQKVVDPARRVRATVRTLQAGRRYAVDVRVLPGATKRSPSIRTRLRVQTDAKAEPEITIPIQILRRLK